MNAAHPKLIWAIARNTVAQAVRVRVAFVIMAVYLVLVPVLPFILKGDGTPGGLLHVVITYSLILAGVLLGLLTLALSTTTLWTEIRDKQIYLLESRPVRRWHILVGKLAGILAVNAALLVFMGIVNVACVEYIVRQEKWGDIEWDERLRKLAREQVLTARRAVSPEPIPENETAEYLDRRYAELKDAGKLPEDRTEAEIRGELRKAFLAVRNAVLPRRIRVWTFHGIRSPRRAGSTITIRFKYTASGSGSDSEIYTRWHFRGPKSDKRYEPYRASRKPDEFQEIEIPANAVDDNGDLHVGCENADPAYPVLIFAGKEAVQVLYPVSGFAVNLARGLFLIFIEVLFLAVLGLFCSTFLTFPVSPIVALTLLLLITLSGSVEGQFEEGFSFDNTKQSKSAALAETIVRGIAAGVRTALPPLDEYAATSRVSSGKEVPWSLLLKATALVAILRGGILMLLGIWIFERRELALAQR